MPVIENNRLSGVENGVIINQGSCWAVVRNNTIKTTTPNGSAVCDDSDGKATNAMILPAANDAKPPPPRSE